MELVKVSDITGRATLVVSRPSEGKTYAIVQDCLSHEFNPLWITATNIDPLAVEGVNWDVARFGTWEEFETFLRNLGEKDNTNPNDYDAVVIDGLQIVSDMYLGTRTSAKEDPRRHYNTLSMLITGMIARLRGQFQNVYVSVDIKATDAGEEIGVNDAMARKMSGLFGNKWYVYAEPEGTGTAYKIQTDPIRALKLKKVTKQNA